MSIESPLRVVLAALLLAALGLGGPACRVSPKEKKDWKLAEGQEFDSRPVGLLREKQHHKPQVQQMLGPPHAREALDDGGERWVYLEVWTREQSKLKLTDMERYLEIREKRATLEFSNVGVLQKVEFRENEGKRQLR